MTRSEPLNAILRERDPWIADAHPGDGKRFVARADEKLTAFLKQNFLSRSRDLIALHANFPSHAILDKGARIFPSRAFPVRGDALLQLEDDVAVPPCVMIKQDLRMLIVDAARAVLIADCRARVLIPQTAEGERVAH